MEKGKDGEAHHAFGVMSATVTGFQRPYIEKKGYIYLYPPYTIYIYLVTW